MGNYFSISSSETKESIKIINEVDHVHVIASENEIASNDFLNEQTQTEVQVQTETESNVDIAEKQTQIDVSYYDDCVVYKKTNTKKKKCKKNKKHLQ
jgi:hypothetical protein